MFENINKKIFNLIFLNTQSNDEQLDISKKYFTVNLSLFLHDGLNTTTASKGYFLNF